MSEPIHCPFCGSSDVDKHGWYDGQGQQGPECMGCGATAPSIVAWNRRYTPPGWQLVPALDDDEQQALIQFDETVRDDGTYSIGRNMIARLACKGAVRHLSAGRYELTDAGQAMLDTAPRPDVSEAKEGPCEP